MCRRKEEHFLGFLKKNSLAFSVLIQLSLWIIENEEEVRREGLLFGLNENTYFIRSQRSELVRVSNYYKY